MKKLVLLFSHRLTNEQVQDAQNNWGVGEINYLPENLQKIWSNITPDTNFEELKIFLEENTSEGDLVLIQGDFGATYKMVSWCLKHHRMPIYSHTAREVVEERNGEEIKKISFFRHKGYLVYTE